MGFQHRGVIPHRLIILSQIHVTMSSLFLPFFELFFRSVSIRDYGIQEGLFWKVSCLTLKLVEQPQVEVAIGFSNLGPGADKSLLQSMIDHR